MWYWMAGESDESSVYSGRWMEETIAYKEMKKQTVI